MQNQNCTLELYIRVAYLIVVSVRESVSQSEQVGHSQGCCTSQNPTFQGKFMIVFQFHKVFFVRVIM